MKPKILLSSLLTCAIFCFCSCSNEEDDFTFNSKKLASTELNVTNNQDSVIMPIEGNVEEIRRLKSKLRTRASYDGNDYQLLQQELRQLDEIPIYLQVQGNSDERRFLSATGKGKEVTVEKFKENSLNQQFYIKILPAVSGIPYLIYSKKTGTPISLGAYKNKPDINVLYAKDDASKSLFGASWDIKRAEYSSNSYIIENQDFPQKGNSGYWFDIYYSVITVNGSKISFSKYNKSPKQEFQIIPVEKFKIESVRFNVDNTATLSQTPELVYSDHFINNGPIEQRHTFTISKTYKETSNFTKKTSYNVSVTTEVSVSVPLVASGKISSTVSGGKEFTYGKSEEHSITINRDYPIVIPANYKSVMKLTLFKYNMDVEYVATCVGMTSGKKIEIRGRWQGVDVQETKAELDLTPINGNTSGAKSITISDDMLKSNKVIKIN